MKLISEKENNCTIPLKLVPHIKSDDISDLEKSLFCRILHTENWANTRLKSLIKDSPDLIEPLIIRGSAILAFEDREQFLELMQAVTSDETKNKLWEINHSSVLWAISDLTIKNSRFPTRYELSKHTGLSHQTISKHIKEYFGSDQYCQNKNEIILMREKVLAVVYKHAFNGDMKAARVFLESTSQFVQPVINNHTNYIQVNGFMVTQEKVKELPPDKLDQIHRIFSMVSEPISE